jgi:hypothetical protein
VPARNGAALARDQRGNVLIADRRRHQCGAERTEPEPGRTTRARYPTTRRRHHPSRQHAPPRLALATAHLLWKRPRGGANATGPFIVGLTLRRR